VRNSDEEPLIGARAPRRRRNRSGATLVRPPLLQDDPNAPPENISRCLARIGHAAPWVRPPNDLPNYENLTRGNGSSTVVQGSTAPAPAISWAHDPFPNSEDAMRRALTAFAVSVAAMTLSATPALAAPTQHFDFPETCSTFVDVTVCSSASGQFHTTETPSGNAIFSGSSTSTFSVTLSDGSSNFRETFTQKFNELVKKGELHVFHSRTNDTFTFNGSTCTFTDNFIFANGEVRHSKPDFSCT
jgi:hypothetical protein